MHTYFNSQSIPGIPMVYMLKVANDDDDTQELIILL